MKTYKNYIIENIQGTNEYGVRELSETEFNELLKENCKNDIRFWRGINTSNRIEYLLQQNIKKKRVSIEEENLHIILMSELESWKNYPRYDLSIICSSTRRFKDKIELKDREVQLSDTIIIDRDINSAINIMKRWFGNHIASMNEPLDFSSVIKKNNLLTKHISL
jgi:hypothetical protein